MKFTLTLVALLFLAVPALAADVPCASDADCGKGDVCILAPCGAPACPPDTECVQPPDCVSQGFCMKAPWDGTCAVDGDCPTGFTCDAVDVPCASGGCAPCTCACSSDGACPPCECPACDVPVDCTPTTTQICQYHAAVCKADGDCKDGWACGTEEVCSGTGCACAPCAPDSECLPCDCPPPPEPTCEVIGAWCKPKETACTAAADCPADFECIEQVNRTGCACPACACLPETPDCGCGICDCPAATITQVCLPKGWAAAGYDGTNTQPGNGLPVDTADVPAPGKESDATPPSTPGTGATETAAQLSGGTGNSCQASPVAGAPLGLFILACVALVPMIRRRFSCRA
jgi:Cys-rich repeat protein